MRQFTRYLAMIWEAWIILFPLQGTHFQPGLSMDRSGSIKVGPYALLLVSPRAYSLLGQGKKRKKKKRKCPIQFRTDSISKFPPSPQHPQSRNLTTSAGQAKRGYLTEKKQKKIPKNNKKNSIKKEFPLLLSPQFLNSPFPFPKFPPRLMV